MQGCMLYHILCSTVREEGVTAFARHARLTACGLTSRPFQTMRIIHCCSATMASHASPLFLKCRSRKPSTELQRSGNVERRTGEPCFLLELCILQVSFRYAQYPCERTQAEQNITSDAWRLSLMPAWDCRLSKIEKLVYFAAWSIQQSNAHQ